MTTRLPKAALSQYLRTRCDRMLACSINETNGSSDTLLSLPARPGLAGFRARGMEFEKEFLDELSTLYPVEFIDVAKAATGKIPRDLVFKGKLEELVSGGLSLPRFFNEPTLVEDRYRAILLKALGVVVRAYPDMTDLRPDLVVAMRRTPDNVAITGCEIRPDGSVRRIEPSDTRIALRVADLKFAEQLNIAYAGEVCLYAMVLSAWLEHPDIALADRFYVSSTPGVLVRHSDRMTGMPEPSASLEERTAWFERQIDSAEADLYAPPVVRFFRDDLKRVIATMPDWHSLEWHVTPTCAFCDYLGYPGWSKRGIAEVQTKWVKLHRKAPAPSLDDYCHEDARRNNRLNHLPNTTRGMLRTLQRGKVSGLEDLRGRANSDAIFGQHNGLRIESHRLPRKAGAVVDVQKSDHPLAMSGEMARYADMLVTVVCFFDAATGLLTSIGMGVDYKSPTEWKDGLNKEGLHARVPATPRIDRKQQMMWVIEEATAECEAKHLLDCMRFLSQFIDYVLSSNAAPDEAPDKEAWAAYSKANARIQVAFWDARQDEAFRKAIGRHLHQITHSRDVANALLWLFPPREIEQSDSIATTPAACHLHDVVTRLVALPTIINDDILSVANHIADFKDGSTPYMWDRVAGVIPKERSLEISQSMPPKTPPMSISQCVDQYRAMLRTIIHGMRQIAFTIQRNHGKQLMGDAPRITDLPPTRFNRIAADSMLWLTHQKVSDGVAELERTRAYTSEPHELEARYQALRVEGLVRGVDRKSVVNGWRSQGLEHVPAALSEHHLLFRVRDTSRHVKFRNEARFLALMPEGPPGAGLMNVAGLCRVLGANTPDPAIHSTWVPNDNYRPLAKLLGARLVHFDRENLKALLAFDFKFYFDKFNVLVQSGMLDLDAPMILMEGGSYSDFESLKDVAELIGNPPIAAAASETNTALVEVKRKPGRDPEKPAATVLWGADKLVLTPTDTDLSHFDDFLDNKVLALPVPAEDKIEINPSQREAIHKVIARQLMPVWGGPGTGKTQTLSATIILEILLRLNSRRARQRIYVTGPTYRAVTEVAARLARILPRLEVKVRDYLQQHVTLSFVASESNRDAWNSLLSAGPQYCGLNTELYLGKAYYLNGALSTDSNLHALRERLAGADDRVELVFSVTNQSYWIGKGGRANKDDDSIEAVIGLFDRIFIDESSQVSVANSLSTLGLLTAGGRLSLFGDPLQMPPIEMIEPPLGAEHMVGSLHTYLTTRFATVEAEECFLKYNYRSCEPIVRYARMIGYKQEFTSKVPRRALTYDAHGATPAGWPGGVPWWTVYDRILEPALPCVAVTYDDGTSGQANAFEATLVAGTVLAYRATEKLRAGGAFSEAKFWVDSLGIVTPHRAQRSAVVELLRVALAPESVPADMIDDAVDTVERFQGGERDLILVSFGIGDPDLIRSEERFLFQRQRINVAISRARAKAVLFISRDLLFHLPDDKDVVLDSRAIKGFAFQLAHDYDPRIKLDYGGEEREVEIRYALYDR
jgi:hypothetical protein